MGVRNIIELRRRAIPVADPTDNVVLEALLLGCAVCGARWQARLGAGGAEVDQDDARCRNCTQEPPRAA